MLDCCHCARSQDSAGPLVMQWREQDTGGKAHKNAWPRVHLASLTTEKLEGWLHEGGLIQDC